MFKKVAAKLSLPLLLVLLIAPVSRLRAQTLSAVTVPSTDPTADPLDPDSIIMDPGITGSDPNPPGEPDGGGI